MRHSVYRVHIYYTHYNFDADQPILSKILMMKILYSAECSLKVSRCKIECQLQYKDRFLSCKPKNIFIACMMQYYTVSQKTILM